MSAETPREGVEEAFVREMKEEEEGEKDREIREGDTVSEHGCLGGKTQRVENRP